MALKEIQSHQDLLLGLEEKKKSYILLFKGGSEQSACALENIMKASENHKDVNVMYADVRQVRDIHAKYDVRTVPSMLVFDGKDFKNVIKGCQNVDYVNSIFENAVFRARSNEEEKPQKNVTVYSTPACTWCNALKSHLRKHRVVFTDIDISQDPSSAEELVRRSGQQGVPQTEIDGEIIVGFDKTRINKLLGVG
ncbi:MAG: glutaredoxin domain-containing protein [Bacteroidales bacterium]